MQHAYFSPSPGLCIESQHVIAAVYNCLLEICARTNDEERGFDIIDRMSKASVPPNKYTLEAVKRRKSLRSYLKRSNF